MIRPERDPIGREWPVEGKGVSLKAPIKIGGE